MIEAFNNGDPKIDQKDESFEGNDRVHEFDFESGVSESVSRIIGILERQPKVVVAFSASSSNVGKTTLAKKIANGLYDRGIKSRSYIGVEEVYDRGPEDGDSVFIFQQMHLGTVNSMVVDRTKDIYNDKVSEALKSKGIDVSGIDFWIGIYSPDKPFASDIILNSNSKPLADILIRNDLAKDKTI